MTLFAFTAFAVFVSNTLVWGFVAAPIPRRTAPTAEQQRDAA